MLLTEKYRPKNTSKFLGNGQRVKTAKQWILNWKRNVKGKPLMISGPVGVGKTTLALALANEFGFELYEFNIAKEHSKDEIKKLFNASFTSNTLFGKPRLLFIDDADHMKGDNKTTISEIVKLVKNPPYPIIITAEDPWARGLVSLRGYCEQIKLKRVNSNSIERYLQLIAEEENIDLNKDEIHEIVRATNGDIRACLNDLQGRTTSFRNTQLNIMYALRDLFRVKKVSEARKISYKADVDPDMFTLWIEENIAKELITPPELAEGFHWLSKSDVFRGRIRKTNNWGFLRYSTILVSAGVALSKQNKSFKFVPYSFPSYIKYMSRTKKKRRLMKEVSAKLKKHGLHGSSKKIKEYLPILKKQIKKQKKDIINHYELEQSEVAFILGVSQKKAKQYFK